MRRVYILLIMCSLAATSFTQTQQGIVKTKGRMVDGKHVAGHGLSGATITVKGRNAVTSNNKGLFSLSLSSNNFFLQNVQKQGYVLTDPDILSKQYAYSENPLILVLETPNQQIDDRLAVERKIRRTLQMQLQEKEDEIELLKEQQKLTDEEYRRRLQEIYALQESKEDLISEMADRYSKMDFDEMDEFNRRISSLILEGKLTEADSLINTKGDLNSRVEALFQHQEANALQELEIATKQKKLEESKVITEKEMEYIALDCYSKFEIFKMQHQNDSAAYYIELRFKLDTTNVRWMMDAGNFMVDYQYRYEDGLSVFKKALACGELHYDKKIDMAECTFCIGKTYYEMGDYDNAITYMTRSIDLYMQLDGEDVRGLATSYNSLGVVYLYKGDKDKAMENSLKGLELRQQIKSDDEELKESIAASYSNLGGIYLHLKKNEEALHCFEKSLELRKTLQTGNKRSLATSYNNLGYAYYLTGNDTISMDYYLMALNIRKEIFGNRHPSIAYSLNNIAGIYYDHQEYDKALNYYLNALDIRKTVFGNTHRDIAISYNNLGTAYFKLHKFPEALECFEKAMECVDNLKSGDVSDLRKIILEYINTTKSAIEPN